MPLEILRGTENASIDALRERSVAVIGYGNQGRAHALNMRDSGLHVVVGCRAGGLSETLAQRDGFVPVSLQEAAAQGDLVIIALPDEAQPEVLRDQVVPHVRGGAAGVTLGFIHGFTVHYRLLPVLPLGIGVVMVAPKGPGTTLRERYAMGQGIPCLLAVDRESASGNARAVALAWANAIGCARAGIIVTTFRDETETDLFGEQAVLCGGMTWLMLAAFETLVEAGYPPELAYLECCHELKQIADLVYERGIAGMMRAISNTAEFGACAAGPAIVDKHASETLLAQLQRVRDGSFARDLRSDYERGFPWFNSQRQRLADHPIEAAGAMIRSLMPWLSSPSTPPPQKTE
jgi:ketol-acid reductoisomerase